MPYNANDDKKNIVFILPSFTAGGAERVLITLMNNLDPAIYNRQLIAIKNEGNLHDLVFPDVKVKALGQKHLIYISYFKLIRRLIKAKPDVVVSTMAPMNWMVLLTKPFFPKTRFIIREAITPSFFAEAGGFKRVMSFFGYKGLYRFADVIISPSQRIIIELRALIGKRNFVLLQNPVDIEKIQQASREIKRPKEQGTVRFLCSGRLHRQKGVDRLIEALPKLKMRSNCPWELLILGKGQERTNLEKSIKHHKLENNVFLMGHLENPWGYMISADYFLLPSRWEGLPNVVLEALACGTPAIATRESGGIAEIADKTEGEDIILVDDMAQMVEEMGKAQPNDDVRVYQPILPECFEKKQIVSNFEEIIKGVLDDKSTK